MKIAVIGAGVCGVAAAKTLKQLGHEVTIFERAATPGGVWSVAYAGVHLQNHRELYAYSDYPWPFAADDYPSAAEIRRYLDSAIAHFTLDVRCGHAVTALTQRGSGWHLAIDTAEGPFSIDADAVVIAAGHYTHEKAEIDLPGREQFQGRVLTEHDITDPAMLEGQRIAILGLGKSAVDMASFAVGHAREIHHIFRAARWLMPRRVFGQLTSRVATERLSGYFARSWVYPHRLQQLTHKHNPRSADINESIVSGLMRRALGLRGGRRDAAAKRRLAVLDPDYPVARQLRGTLAPDNYIPAVARGDIQPRRATVAGLSADAVLFEDGSSLAVDTVILALGYKRPALPFLPVSVRDEFDSTPDGVQLYRHIVHPAIPGVMFAGFNHSPLHLVSSEIAALWFDASMRGDLALPPAGEMEASRRRVESWKRANTLFDPTRAYWVSAHMHNYIDAVLGDLGLNSRRKSNPISEWLGHYSAADYATLIDEYQRQRGTKRTVLPLDT